MSENGVPKRCEWQSGDHRHLNCRDKFTGPHPENGETENFVRIPGNEGFHESLGLGQRSGSQHVDHRHPREAIGNALLLRFSFVQANSREFGVGKHAKRNLPTGGDAVVAKDVISHDSVVVE